MKDLKNIIKSLSKKEVKFITDYYKNNEEKKRLLLFKGIYSGKLTTDEEAAKRIYNKKGSAYSHLKTRLKDDLLNLLLFFNNDNENLPEVVKAEIDVDRLLIQAKSLHRRKATELSIKLLEKAHELTEKYELIKEKIIVSYWYSIIAGNKYGYDVFNEITNSFEKDIMLLNDYLLSYKARYQLSLYNKFSKGNVLQSSTIAKKSFKTLEKINSKNNSKNIEYYFYITAIGYYTLNKDYDKLYFLAKKMNNLILNNVEVNSKVQIVNSYLQLFNATLHLKKYEKANQNAIKAYEVIHSSNLRGGSNELSVLEYIFLSSLRLDNINDTYKHLKEGLKHDQIKTFKKNKEKWQFFEASYFFKIKEFSASLSSLYKIQELLQDKSGWLFTFKLIEIMCYIEQEEFDMVNYRIETFRKLLSKKNNENIVRIKTIHQILKLLLKNGFNFSKTYQKELKNIELLKSGEKEFYWNPLGFELIRFDEWFLNKILHKVSN